MTGRSKYHPRIAAAMTLAAALLAVFVLLSACSLPGRVAEPPGGTDATPGDTIGQTASPDVEPDPQPQDTTEPEATQGPEAAFSNLAAISTRALDGSFTARQPAQTISPDGRYILLEARTSREVSFMALSLDPDANSDDDTVFTPKDKSWADPSFTWFTPLGWVSESECAYLVFGAKQTPDSERRGVAVVAGDATTGETVETAFIDLTGGILRCVTTNPATKKTVLHVSGALWEYDMVARNLRLVRGDLPTYDGLFHPCISPTCEHVAYRIEGENGGVRLVTVASGEERQILPDAQISSFLPIWSPDGQFLAVYTVTERPEPGLEAWERYMYLQGEDGPLPIGSSITVVDLKGGTTSSIEFGGKLISGLTWGQDSRTLVFLTGTATSQGAWPLDSYRRLAYEQVIAVDMSDGQRTAYSLADFRTFGAFSSTDVIDYASIVHASKQSAYFNVFAGADSTLWLGLSGCMAQWIDDGSWQQTYGSKTPSYGDHTVAVLSGNGGSRIWLLGPDSASKLAETDSWTDLLDIAGFAESLLVVRKEDFSSGKTAFTVYEHLAPK